jgi:hypothetical protein
VDDGEAQRDQEVLEVDVLVIFMHCFRDGDEGDEAIPEDEGFIDLELIEEETVEPLDARYLEAI